MVSGKPCEVVTFYSYTGGAGRSMALANVACLLARRAQPGRGVLMVDWNLNSPSLHYYFLDKVRGWSGNTAGAALEAVLDRQAGLLDLFTELDAALPSLAPGAAPEDVFERLRHDRFVIPTDIPALSLLKAGRFDGASHSAAARFPWVALLERAPWLVDSLRAYWARRYQYVLIDSSSGVNDMSKLCAWMLPDKLVAAFTPGRQSLDGALEAARSAWEYRKTLGNHRPLAVFPLPAKLDASEPGLRHDWRFGGETGESEGYLARFERLFDELWPEAAHSLEDYFNEILIPYVPRYIYGEEIAVARNSARNSPLVGAYRNLAGWLAGCGQPWDSFQGGDDLNSIEIGGRLLTLADGETLCLNDIESYVAARDHLGAAASLEILASIKERLGKPAEAEAHYFEAVALYRAKQYDAGIASAAAGLARLERLLGRIEEARMYYLDACKIYRKGTPGPALASTLATLGDLDFQLGEFQAAGEHYREAIERYRAEWDDAGVARALLRLGELEKRLGNFDQAQERFRLSAQLFRKERNSSGLARALTSLGDVQNRAGKTDQSEQSYSRAVELYRGERDVLQLAYALRNLADVERSLARADQARNHYVECIELLRKENEGLGLASALEALADLESRTAQLDNAKLHYEEAMVLYRKEENYLGVANALRSLGDLERRMGRLDACRSDYEQAMDLYRAEGNNIGLANALQSLGDLEKRLGRSRDAEQRYTQAIQIYRGEGASLGCANALKSLGDVEAEAGYLNVARDHYEQAVKLYRAGGRTLGLANALQSLGDLERRQKRYKEATGLYSTARDLYRMEKHMTGLAYTCSELARVAHALFDFTGSIEYLSEAITAAHDSHSPAVLDYVRDVQQEIQGKPAVAR